MSRRFAIIGLVAGLCASTVLLGLLAGFVPQHEGPEIRRRASNTVVVLRAEDFPAPIVASSEGGYRWSVRESAVPPGASVPPASAGSTALRENVVMFLEEGVSLLTAGHPKLVGSDVAADAFIPLLPLDGSPDHLFLVAAPPADYGETLDIGGRPVRWLAVQDAGIRRLDPECDLSHPVASLPSIREEQILPLPRMRAFNTGDTFTRARRYKELVERSARRFGLSTDLVYAIIHNESNFSPVLVSSRSAMGLMQLLPSTAGGEVHKFLYGRPGKVSFADLANPEVNIHYGTAYLHLLLNRHLGQVRNPVSREYCAVAAYNMGPNRFLRMFASDKTQAFEIINNLTPEEVFRRLTRELPVTETRFFVAKVARSRGEFAAFQ